MLRSAEPWRRAGLVCALAMIMGAAGSQLAAGDESPRPGPVLGLIAHTYDLRAVSVDRTHTARVATGRDTIDVRVDANVAFAKDSATLQPAARERLGQVAEQLRAAGPGVLEISGFTDNLGSHEHGLELSRQRAQAVATQLGAIPGMRIVVRGEAEANPVAPNTTEAGRAQNRRVEIRYRHQR